MKKYRLYSFVLYQLSPIQKGIQAWHAGEEYVEQYKNTDEVNYRKNDKTVIILDGGTYLNMLDIINNMELFNIKYSIFREPDLNDIITSICIMVDEKIYDRINHPDYPHDDTSNLSYLENQLYQNRKFGLFTENEIKLRNYLSKFRLAS